MRKVIMLWLKIVGFVCLILSVWVSTPLALAGCPEGPWGEVGRFAYGTIDKLAYSPDAVHVAVAGSGGVTIWNPEKAMAERVLSGQPGHVSSVAWSPDGTQLASGSSDRTVRVWSAEDGRLLRTLTGHTGSVNSVAWSPDGCSLVSGSDDGTVRWWAAAPEGR